MSESLLTNGAALGASRTSRMARLPLLVMLSGIFMVVLDFFIVNVALPSIEQQLHAPHSVLQWVVAGYGLATAAGLITGGRLGDLYGRKRMFMLGMLLFAAASAACGMASTGAGLVAARVVQGLAGALLQPQVLAILSVTYTGHARARAFAAYGMTLGLAATLGQLVGGVLIEWNLAGLGWRNCFLINVPVGAVALLLATRGLPHDAPTHTGHRLDMVGTFLASAAAVALVWPLVEGPTAGWPDWALWTMASSLAFLAALAVHLRRSDRRGRDPLVSWALLRNRQFTAGLLTVLAFYAGNASLYFVLALYLQQGLGLAPLASGLVFTVLALGFFATSLAAPRLANALGGAPISRGALLLMLGHGLQWLVVSHAAKPGELAWGLPVLLVQGAGLGMVMAPLASAVLAGLPAHQVGAASGVLSTIQQVGNALGVALIGLVFYRVLPASGMASAFSAALGYLAGSALLVAVIRWLGQRKD